MNRLSCKNSFLRSNTFQQAMVAGARGGRAMILSFSVALPRPHRFSHDQTISNTVHWACCINSEYLKKVIIIISTFFDREVLKSINFCFPLSSFCQQLFLFASSSIVIETYFLIKCKVKKK